MVAEREEQSSGVKMTLGVKKNWCLTEHLETLTRNQHGD